MTIDTHKIVTGLLAATLLGMGAIVWSTKADRTDLIRIEAEIDRQGEVIDQIFSIVDAKHPR